ncbi:MAG: F0F1 ATP synthase subunit B [Verrucomicrobia bacterium]|nr:F0F1 ATP synthase subunit B [Verrucomicrobiota bacterium]
MADSTYQTEETVAHPPEHHQESGPLSVDAQMVIWTWVTFGIVAVILGKFAWKPILSALDARETRIRDAIENARLARIELEKIEETSRRLLDETDNKCKTIIAEAREAANQAAAHVEQRANEKVQIMYENAERDIGAMTNQAIAKMRQEQINLVVDLAGRLVTEELNTDRHRDLADKLIREL